MADVNIQQQVQQQGEIVRKLKEAKAPKEDVRKKEVSIGLVIYTNITRYLWKLAKRVRLHML